MTTSTAIIVWFLIAVVIVLGGFVCEACNIKYNKEDIALLAVSAFLNSFLLVVLF